MFKRVFYGWWIVLACFMISFYVGGVIFFGFTAFFEPIREELGWSYTQISLASSLRGLEMGIFAPLIGVLVDRFGSRRLLLGGTLTMGVGLILLSRTGSLLTFYGAFLLLAFGAGGCTSVVTMTAVARWFRRNVGIALGVMASGFGASGVIVPLIVGLIDLYTWRTTLIILAVGMWLLGLPLSMVIRDRPEPYGCFPDGVRPSTPGEAESEQAGSMGVPFLEAFKNASFLLVNLAEAVRLLAVTAVVVHVMPYLQHVGIERKFAGLLAGSIPLVSILGRFGFGWLSDKVEKRVVMAVSFLIMAAGLLAFSYVHIPGMLLVFLLLFSPGFGGSMVLRGAILREYFGTQAFGKLIGIVLGAGSVGGIIGPTLAGWIFDTLGSYRPVWLALSGLTFLASGLVLQVRPAKVVDPAVPLDGRP